MKNLEGPQQDPNPSPKEEMTPEAILEEINSAMEEIGWRRFRRVPEVPPECENLKGKKVMMVDDDLGVLKSILPPLIAATDGETSSIYHQNEVLKVLTRKIIEANPEIILLDYSLAAGLTGPEVAQALKEEGFSGEIIGFSSDPGFLEDFKEAGVSLGIKKGTYDPQETLKAVAEVLEKQTENDSDE